jgi:hypothetical protein
MTDDPTGRRFGRWTVIGTSEPKRYTWRGHDITHRVWVCQCDCGTVRSVLAANLLAEKSTSCGCWHREAVQGWHQKQKRKAKPSTGRGRESF